MKKQTLSAVQKPLKKEKVKRLRLHKVFCRRVVSHYTLDKGLVGKEVFYFLFNRVVFHRDLFRIDKKA